MNEFFLYQPASFFMARYANLPYKSLAILEGNNKEALLALYRQNPLFQEAVALASFDLHQALKKWDFIADPTSFYFSLSKYLIRMGSRATPFGLFSSVGWGNFANVTDLSFDPNLLKKKVFLGTESIASFLESFQKVKQNVKKLKVKLNPQLIHKNGRVFLNNDHPDFQEDYTSIKITQAFEQVRIWTQVPIEYQELENKIVSFFPDIFEEKAKNYLWELFLLNFLICELKSTVFIRDFANNFAKILHQAEKKEEVFESLIPTLDEYERSLPGEKLYALEKSIFTLKNLFKEVKNPLRVDHFYDSNQIMLHQNVQKSVALLADVLAKICFSFDLSSEHKQFYSFFSEKYGTDRLVPFAEVLQTSTALEILANQSIAKEEIENITPIEHLLIPQEEIDLTSVMDKISPLTEEKLQKLPPSIEIYFEIEAPKQDDLEKNDFKLVLRGMSNQAGSMFGRFLYFWQDDKIKELQEFIKEENRLLSHLIFVDASFVPEKQKVGNVSLGKPLRPIKLPMDYDGEQGIDLEDLYLGIDHQKVYCFSKKLQKEIVVTPSVMTNPLFMPIPLRFLLFLSDYQFSKFSGRVASFLGKRVYYPRIVYKNLILSAAEWILSYSLLNLSPSITKEALYPIVKESFKTYKIPSKILLVQGDNHLQLDSNNELHFDLILREFMKAKRIIFNECREKENFLLVKSPEGGHVCEFVVPLLRQTKSITVKKFYPPCQQLNERTFYPGSNWWFAKIYLSPHEATFFLTQFLSPFFQELEKTYKLQWFFIRYNEGGFHIRLRVYSLDKTLFAHLNEWLTSLARQGEIEDFSLNAFKPEVERYGGPESIELAENIFAFDTKLILKILSEKSLPLPPFLIASISIIKMLNPFLQRHANMLVILQQDNQKGLLEGTRNFLKMATELTKALVTHTSLANLVFYNFLNEAFCDFDLKIEQFATHIFVLERENKLWNLPEKIVDSLIHMHCNRFLGISPLLEKKARAGALLLLEKIKHPQFI